MTDSFYKDPDVTPFFCCPNCRRLLGLAVNQCPYCRELIDDTQKMIGATVNVTLSQACSLANTISTGDPAVLIFLGVTVLAFLVNLAWLASFTILSALIAVGAIIRWRRRYGWLPLDDADFLTAKREMRQSLMLWIAFLMLECLIAYASWVGIV